MRLLATFDAWAGHVPSSMVLKIQHHREKRRYHNYLKRHPEISDSIVDPGPIGPTEIILKTSIQDEKDIPIKLNPDFYFLSGCSMVYSMLRSLERCSFNFRNMKAVLELGCGSARLIRHLRCLQGVRLVGTDVKQDFVDWCRANIPGIEFYTNDLQPPLSFAEDDSFDFVFAHSVFTHIPLDIQDSWIKEIYRVLRPSGFLIVTVSGRNYGLQTLDHLSRKRLEQEGNLTLDATHSNASYSTRAIGSWDVYQSEEEILSVFGSTFHIHEVQPGTHDLLVMEKRLHT